MSRKIEMRGMNFNSLYVLKEAGIYISPGGSVHDRTWLCLCDCGKQSIVRGAYLRNGHTKTCGHCREQTFAYENGHMRCTCGNGDSFIFDCEDIKTVQLYRWYIDNYGYICASTSNHRSTKLHRLLMNAQNGEVVDHINGNPRDCRKSNLRIITQRENTYNSGARKSSTTGYKGVCFDKRRGKYAAYITPDGKHLALGYHGTPEAAAEAYNVAALRLYGDKARLNVIGCPFQTIPAKNIEKRRDSP